MIKVKICLTGLSDLLSSQMLISSESIFFRLPFGFLRRHGEIAVLSASPDVKSPKEKDQFSWDPFFMQSLIKLEVSE